MLQIRVLESGQGGEPQLVLCDEAGVVLPGQIATELTQVDGEPSTFAVRFHVDNVNVRLAGGLAQRLDYDAVDAAAAPDPSWLRWTLARDAVPEQFRKKFSGSTAEIVVQSDKPEDARREFEKALGIGRGYLGNAPVKRVQP